MDFDIAVIAVGFARQHGFQAHLLGAAIQRQQRIFRVRHHSGVVLRLRHLDQIARVPQFIGEFGNGAERTVQLLALAHQLLRGLRIVPDGRVFGLGVQFVQAAIGLIPVKDASSAGQLPAQCRRRHGIFLGA
jgi:hypothetical protein